MKVPLSEARVAVQADELGHQVAQLYNLSPDSRSRQLAQQAMTALFELAEWLLQEERTYGDR